MRAIVLLPADASWRPFALVSVESHGDVDADLPNASAYGRQVNVDLHAVDDALEELRIAVGERAIELGGVALDARSLEPLVEAPAVPTEDPEDPGPIWEHLPGAWDPGPATGEVVDSTGVVERLEAELGHEMPDSLMPRTVIGLRLLLARWFRSS